MLCDKLAQAGLHYCLSDLNLVLMARLSVSASTVYHIRSTSAETGLLRIVLARIPTSLSDFSSIYLEAAQPVVIGVLRSLVRSTGILEPHTYHVRLFEWSTCGCHVPPLDSVPRPTPLPRCVPAIALDGKVPMKSACDSPIKKATV